MNLRYSGKYCYLWQQRTHKKTDMDGINFDYWVHSQYFALDIIQKQWFKQILGLYSFNILIWDAKKYKNEQSTNYATS